MPSGNNPSSAAARQCLRPSRAGGGSLLRITAQDHRRCTARNRCSGSLLRITGGALLGTTALDHRRTAALDRCSGSLQLSPSTSLSHPPMEAPAAPAPRTVAHCPAALGTGRRRPSQAPSSLPGSYFPFSRQPGRSSQRPFFFFMFGKRKTAINLFT